MHLLVSLLLATALLAVQSCGRELAAKERGEPCTSSSECDSEMGLVCRSGTCDYPADTAAADGS